MVHATHADISSLSGGRKSSNRQRLEVIPSVDMGTPASALRILEIDDHDEVILSKCHDHRHEHHHLHHKSHPSIEKSTTCHSKEVKEVEVDASREENDIAIKKLRNACLCSLVFMLVEFIGGYYAQSLAIMTDAAHLLSDVAGFAVSLFAIYLGTLPANAKMPFGYQRAEVIGAIISVFLIWLLTIWLLYTAISRIIQQAEQNAKDAVKGKAMFFISSFGLCVNLLLMRILGHGHSHGLSHSHGHSHGLSHCDSHGHSHGLSHSDSHGHSRGHSHEHGHRHSHDHENYLHHRHHHHDDDDDEKDISKPVAEHPVEDPPFGQDAVECGSTDLDHPELKLKTSNVDLTQESSSISSSWDQAFANFENINVRAAYIHALSDFIQSLGVCVAGALIWYNPDWQIADPLTTIFFSILVLVATFGIMKNSIMILMEATPIGIHTPSIELKLLQLESVFDVKQLHIWSLTEGRMAANLHIEYNGSAAKQALVDSKRVLKEQGIEWITIQVEEPSSSRSYETQTL